jgi:hypothetical protein
LHEFHGELSGDFEDFDDVLPLHPSRLDVIQYLQNQCARPDRFGIRAGTTNGS